MGECAYYLKAAFATEAVAKKMESKFDEFFAEAREAYELYQSGRQTDPKEFWKEFSKQCPLVMEYVKTIPDYKPGCDPNFLSGNLDFGQDENNEVLRQGNVLCWGDCQVWHMADWSYLAAFLKSKYGANRVVWNTEENGCGSLDSLQLYDWEGIVQAILKQKDVLPLLLKVHEDLDELLESKLK